MIRFFEGSIESWEPIDVAVFPDSIQFGENVWEDGKVYFKNYLSHDVSDVVMLSVKDEKFETVCFAFMDDEANRELRMLKELEMCDHALQMKDIFPEIEETVIVGCNELAYYFAKYLEKQHIKVVVTGKYWEWFGYQCGINVNLDGPNRMVVFAEGHELRGGLYNNVIKSVSSEFECIDKIYEANVQAGKIKDTEGELSSVLDKLRGKKVVILGIDEKSQDVYDFLYNHGIDIYCFAKQEVLNADETLLAKKILEIRDVVCQEKDVAFIDCHSKNSAMGNRNVELFDYYGYVRNRHFFFINDYTDIPFSNLIHILKNKCVRVAGEETLCHILSEYLEDVEQGEVDVRYIKLSQYTDIKERNMLFIVYPWYGVEHIECNPKLWAFREELLQMQNISYSTYFSRTAALAIIDQYINRQKEKYSIKQLIPKGILLGRIVAVSGNIFLRSILDGHPNILKWGHNRMNKNLFLYCIRLAKEKAENIIKSFKNMFLEELITNADSEIPRWDIFEQSVKRLLSLKDSFSSQELFVIFHIAYAEMMYGEKITDVSSKIIYWEPHQLPRNEFVYLAQWLEDEKINGQTICMHRDHIVWMGSNYKFYPENSPSLEVIRSLAIHNLVETEEKYQTWEEFHVRFEDIKLHPEQELMKICDRLGIHWSDTFLQSTNEGKTWFYDEVKDFDLRPVFNNYEKYLSTFDRFRISLIARPYQKKYGYAYENSMKFSRSVLQEMFLKPFRFQEGLNFDSRKERIEYYWNALEIIRWELWEVRKHEVLDDIIPVFGKIELFESAYKDRQKMEEIHRLIDFIRHQDKLVLYGTGKDCEALLDRLGSDKPEIIFCDLRAVCKDITFHEERVIAPTELNGPYNSYKILITPSRHYGIIRDQLEHLFEIDSDRIMCNRYQLWEDE